ncbi:hypothetical protein [Phyllobacterium sophorae]|uniref:alpha/beta fold hydrolase n=1 Tax=Phyllobacterium sophorae TaxID=1520277 RepID=UPI0014728E3D
MPTLVIHGKTDPTFPIEHGEAIASVLSGATLVRVEGGGMNYTRRTGHRSPKRSLNIPKGVEDNASNGAVRRIVRGTIIAFRLVA